MHLYAKRRDSCIVSLFKCVILYTNEQLVKMNLRYIIFDTTNMDSSFMFRTTYLVVRFSILQDFSIKNVMFSSKKVLGKSRFRLY